MTGRVFGASLKPAWSEQKIHEFLSKTMGDIIVYIINHNQDLSESGEQVETHTHIYLEYTNPRKISTVANLLEVETNFIEVVRNKKGYLRYLTHLDDDDKHRYDADEVYTNSDQEYSMRVRGNAITDKEIAEYMMQGRGMELLGVVSPGRLRTIQSLLHFDNSNIMLNEIRSLNNKMNQIIDVVDNVEKIAVSFANGLNFSANELVSAMKLIANEISKTRAIASTRKRY